ncbi:MAG: TIGR02300 family protein [Hyphomicrobiaceae bacterium]|nr:TIGR02300 family protein [Hyphomicrobiaceae bacterium]
MSDALTCARTARGTKRRCPSCERPFYDLERANVACPYCGEAVRPVNRGKPDATVGKQQRNRVKWAISAPIEPTETHELAANDD